MIVLYCHVPGMNMGGTSEPYWWCLGFQKAVLLTVTTDWCVLGQWRVTATISASTWSTYTWKKDDTQSLAKVFFSLNSHILCRNKIICDSHISFKNKTTEKCGCNYWDTSKWRQNSILLIVRWQNVPSWLINTPASYCSHNGHATCMNPLTASSWCSLLRASLPAMIPDRGPTSPNELGSAAGFHLG